MLGTKTLNYCNLIDYKKKMFLCLTFERTDTTRKNDLIKYFPKIFNGKKFEFVRIINLIFGQVFWLYNGPRLVPFETTG